MPATPVATIERLEVPPLLFVRMRFLQLSLDRLAQRDASRTLSGSLQLGLGGALGTAAVFVDNPPLRGFLGLAGAVGIARGVTQLSLSTHAEQASEELREPILDMHTLHARLQSGERALSHAARRARVERIVEGSLTMFASAAFVPVTYGLLRLDDADHRFGNQAADYVGLSLAVITFASGLVHAIVEGDAERALARYRELPR